ncbi:uncharacterized protein LOC100837260 isoform X2 [Brachypodium distachyon]|uniref:Uncharacterized protein n=1 Tax=Brachypodium distachyon TaxID=15368 RepID=A0A0Q3GED0_BRADI|nr:uncharacterized protein LOC100837260 isoform X2 [Brachypodium distachyon]KQK08805.1 hypothetical protein BRADI_2g44000v3 [Brachypodium distachyon]|eukprot:XP_003569390.1 uncharacterized protein LOC100837260 isoform X2 [Brachypodium distachyon]
MQVLRLLAARRFRRRAVSTITASATAPATPCGCGYYGYGEDEGPFFDLDLSSCCSAPASSAESGSESEDSSSCAAAEADFVISLQRSRSSASHSSSSYERLSFGGCGWAPPPARLKFCASEPNDAAARFSASCRRGGKLRTLSFGSAKAAFYGGRASFSRSSRSARLFFAAAYGGHGGSPLPDQEADEAQGPPSSASRDVFRRYLKKISRRLRRVAPGAAAAGDLRLRKSRSASAAQTSAAAQSLSSSPPRRDDSLLEKQDGIASAIAHCKESLHRASVSECDSSLLRSRSDPGT